MLIRLFLHRPAISTAILLTALAGSAAAAPAYRIENAMVYDTVGRRHVMFGGFDSRAPGNTATRFNDIWEYDGATRTWYNVTPVGGAVPAARSGHTMAFDPSRRVIVLFGGWNQTSGYLNDTWEWNCAERTWTRITPATSPSARHGARMTYDAAGARTVLFGGVDANTYFAQTWVYNTSAHTWTNLGVTNSPPGRTFHGMVYNTSNTAVTVFGGHGRPNNVEGDFNDLWELRGTVWTNVTPAGTRPGVRGWFGMSYEAAANRIVVYGGWNNTAAFLYADTWAWNGLSWSQLVANSPPGARDSFAMTYDIVRARSVVFGGFWSDLWELSGSTWTSVATTDGSGPPPPTPPPGIAPDVDGDGLTDLVVYRPSGGQWHVRKSTAGYSYSQTNSYWFGLSSDRPLAGDYDGDGLLDFVLWRPSTGHWFIRFSASNYAAEAAYQWGLSGDVPLSGDFDGDRRNDLVVFRPSTGEWFVRLSSTGPYSTWVSYQWGLRGDVPMPADFDGDRRADLAVFRPSTGEWFIRFSASNYSYATQRRVGWGLPGDKPITGDFDGDGRADIVVYRPSNGWWYILQSSADYAVSASRLIGFGLGDDLPLAPVDFDGDRRADIVVWRPSTGEWYILYSTGNYSQWGVHQWGVPGDVPIVSR